MSRKPVYKYAPPNTSAYPVSNSYNSAAKQRSAKHCITRGDSREITPVSAKRDTGHGDSRDQMGTDHNISAQTDGVPVRERRRRSTRTPSVNLSKKIDAEKLSEQVKLIVEITKKSNEKEEIRNQKLNNNMNITTLDEKIDQLGEVLPVKCSLDEDKDLAEFPDFEKTGKKFIIQNNYLHLTYPCQFDEATFLEHIKALAKPKNVEVITYSIVKEFGKRKTETGEPYPHLHAAFYFRPQWKSTKPNVFDYLVPETGETVHPNIRKVKKCRWPYLCGTYHRKDGIPYTNYDDGKKGPTLEELLSCSSDKEVTELMAGKGDILKSGLAITAWRTLQKPSVNNVDRFKIQYPWQDFITDSIDSEMSNVYTRPVIWFYDQSGGMGKTTFSDYLKSRYNGCVLTTTNERNGLLALSKHVKEHGEPKIVIVDIWRSKNPNRVYNLLESLTNRNSTVDKYRSQSINLKSNPLVVVFSNTYPDTQSLTMDRWIVTVPNYSGEQFDFVFEGTEGTQFINLYGRNHELEKEMCKEIGEPFSKINPFDNDTNQRLSIDKFEESIPYLSQAKRKTYWDRHMLPVISFNPIIMGHKSSSAYTGIVINEIPMSPEYAAEYDEYVLAESRGEHVKGGKKNVELEDKIQDCSDKYIARRKAEILANRAQNQ